jgi:hypothetical protein
MDCFFFASVEGRCYPQLNYDRAGGRRTVRSALMAQHGEQALLYSVAEFPLLKDYVVGASSTTATTSAAWLAWVRPWALMKAARLCPAGHIVLPVISTAAFAPL